ncbi:hypothetical protein WMY93_003226 [Mugilogobius chulae]|uniref:RING-type domain-containing protein n=1 Tax=Mugilogobius chulae TaxID=88201 RepID=A0AAW0PXN3_9GOBI
MAATSVQASRNSLKHRTSKAPQQIPQVFSEPVSTPCGHNFCKRCISEAWDTAGLCTCPLCKEVFSSRPELKVNTLLRELVSERKLDKTKVTL